jgi:hypothetical protein
MFESYTIQKILAQCATPAQVHKCLKQRGFTHILYDATYVFGEMSSFSAHEKALFSAFQENYLELIKTEEGRYGLYRLI